MKKTKKISKFDKEAEEVEEETPNVPDDNMKNGEFIIPIKGEIGWDVTVDSINDQLKKAEGRNVIFEIASPGGSVFEGVEIFNAIRNYEGKTEARIVGMAASMASYIPLATDKVLAEDNATYMIHNAWGIVIGDSEEMKDQSEIMESINNLLAQEYVNKTGKSEKDILKLMADETWLFGSEIKEEGFIDEMIAHNDDYKKKDKTSAITEAKDKFKSTLSKIKESRMKSDLEKMRIGLNNLKNAAGVEKMKKMCKFKKWSNALKKDLPDSAFAVVFKQGDQTIRKLPYKDVDGKVDIPHLRNAIVMIVQRKTDLSPSQRAMAMKKLKAVAKKYLKTDKITKSGKIMKASISKFESDSMDKLKSIIETLKEKSTNKKPDDEISFSVKKISYLIQDIEEVVESMESSEDGEETADDVAGEKTKEEKTDKEEPKKDTKETKEGDEEKEEEKDTSKKKSKEKKSSKEEKEAEETDEGKEEKKDEEEKKETKEETKEEDNDEGEEEKSTDSEEEEESKFKELVAVCEGYKDNLDEKDLKISKMSQKIKKLEGQNEEISKNLSKFKADSFAKTLNKTVELVSKFRGLNEEQSLRLKEHYLTSKMSESALGEIGRKTGYQMMSKMATEPEGTTKPTEHLAPVDEEKDFSKMSKPDQLDKLAEINAKTRGYVIK